MNAISNAFRHRSRRDIARTIIILLGLATVPLLYAGMLTWSNIDPIDRLDHVPAAIVNDDEGSHDPDLELGTDLTHELTTDTSSTNFAWKPMSASEARQALDKGEVYAVLTIPKGFSKDAASISDNDASKAKKAQVTITTNDATNMISGNIASTIATTVSDKLASKVSEGYLENIYAGFTTINGKMGDAATGARDLANGSGKARDGSGDLVVGLGDLHSGAVTLNDGAGQIAGGASKLNTATGKVATGANQVNTGAIKLKGGIKDAHDGSEKLATGLDSLEEKTSALPSGADKLETGAKKIQGGAHDLLDGAEKVRDGSNSLAENSPKVAGGAQRVDSGLADLEKNWSHMSDAEKLGTVKKLHEGSTSVAEGTEQMDQGIQRLSKGANKLVGTPGGKNTSPTGIHLLVSGTDRLAQGAGKLRENADKLSGAVTSLSDGATSLNNGLGKLETGANDLTAGTGRLSQGASSLSSGASKLATATGDLARGSQSLAEGSSDAEQGAKDLSSGLGDINKGANDLKDGINKGKDDVPTFSDKEAKELAGVSAKPVDLVKQRENEVAGYGSGLAPYFMSLSLWVGALGFFLMVNALNSRLLGSEMPAAVVALASYAPAAAMAVVQSALMVATVHFMVGVSFAHLWPAFWIAVLASLAFMAVNQALVVLLGPPGRYLALILIVLQLSAAGATYPIETTPQFFQTMHNWLPITHLVEAFRSSIAGGSYGYESAIWVLSTYLVVSLVALTLGVYVKRRVKKLKGVKDEGAALAAA